MTTSDRRNNFDLLRLLAAFQVVYFHSLASLGVSHGDDFVSRLLALFPGVPIFFAISGFLIMQAYQRAASLRSYARNRLLRIYPGLWACFAVSLVLLGAFGMLPGGFVASKNFALWVVAQLTVVQFDNPDALRGFGVGVLNGSLWTIPVELQFYAAVPAIDWVGRRCRSERVLTLSLALAAALSFTLWYLTQNAAAPAMWQKLLQVSLLPHLFMFMFGVILQRHWNSVAGLLEERGWIYLGLYLAVRLLQPTLLGLVASGPLAVPVSWAVSFVSLAILALLTISLAFTNRGMSQLLLRGFDLSYGTYIYHMLVLNTMVQLDVRRSIGLLVPVLGCTLALAAGSWLVVERPALALKETRRDRTVRRAVSLDADDVLAVKG